ncbi:unnamed protein product [Ectocarpus fasciculatus]
MILFCLFFATATAGTSSTAWSSRRWRGRTTLTACCPRTTSRPRRVRARSTFCGRSRPVVSPTSTSSTPGTWTSCRTRPRGPSTARWRPRSRTLCASWLPSAWTRPRPPSARPASTPLTRRCCSRTSRPSPVKILSPVSTTTAPLTCCGSASARGSWTEPTSSSCVGWATPSASRSPKSAPRRSWWRFWRRSTRTTRRAG